jgi:DNA invertase Pin-like site-specific DNA recombinase
MNGKIKALHRERKAYVYVRQSTAAQVHEHVESRQRQYALAERAASLGWDRTAVEIVDEDQGKSGASTQGRDGFARLAHDVAHGKVGAIFAVEVSRLARSSQDWQRLLSLCAVAHVVVVDEQTVYDPSCRDDKLLLDLKGAMSEQELHWLSLRMAGGRLNKARRGESYVTPPVGYVWSGRGLGLDPDESVRRAVEAIFARFAVEPSAHAVLRWTAETSLVMPVRDRATSEVRWAPLSNSRLNTILRNPAYAGVYVFGRHPVKTVLRDGQVRKIRARLGDPKDWPVRIDKAHPAYITWETYMSNQEKLRQNRPRAFEATRGAPREGAAMLAGVVLCGRCGRRMSVRYGSRSSAPGYWSYACSGEQRQRLAMCWSVCGETVDRAVEQLFLETMVPSELDLSIAVEREVQQQSDSLDKAWRTRIEHVRYEARHAERRYKAVDPDNRVVARTLESDWEQRLRELQTVEQEYAEARRLARVDLSAQDRARIRQLARDLPAVWSSPTVKVEIVSGPPMIKDENGVLVGYVFADIDLAQRDLGGWVNDAKKVVADTVRVPPGYRLMWTRQYEFQEEMEARMAWVLPLALVLVVLLLRLAMRGSAQTSLVLTSLPFSLIGSIWLLFARDYNVSTAVWVGLIAVLGTSVETAILMVEFLDAALERRREAQQTTLTRAELDDVIVGAATGRIRPVVMSVASTVLGLLPLMWEAGPGADVAARIAAPLVGGLGTCMVLTLGVLPAIYSIWRGRQLTGTRLR